MGDVLSNCFIFAFKQFFKRYWQGYSLVLQKSRFGWWPHAMISPDLKTFVQFAPNKPKRKRKSPPLLFKGKVRRVKGKERTV